MYNGYVWHTCVLYCVHYVCMIYDIIDKEKKMYENGIRFYKLWGKCIVHHSMNENSIMIIQKK